MNPDAQEEFDKILTIDPKNLTQEQIEFLRARRDYLKDSQADEYAEVLKENSKEEEPKQDQTSEESEKPNPVLQDGKNERQNKK